MTSQYSVTSTLAGSGKPTIETLDSTQAYISVQDDNEVVAELYIPNGVSYLWMPTKGGQPPTEQQVDQAMAFWRQQASMDKVTVVHCSSGNRRTGTLLAALLIKDGLGWEEAVEKVKKVNPNADLKQVQLDFLSSLKPAS
jgi:atypical dual specificity phosphatase